MSDKIRLIISGNRDFDDKYFAYLILNKITEKLNMQNTEIVCSMAKGADSIGLSWANENNLKIKQIPLNWFDFGKRSISIRNNKITKYGNLLVAFWDHRSYYIKDMISLAKRKKMAIRIVDVFTGKIVSISRCGNVKRYKKEIKTKKNQMSLFDLE